MVNILAHFDQVRLVMSHLMETSILSNKFLIQFAYGSLKDQTSNLMVTIPCSSTHRC